MKMSFYKKTTLIAVIAIIALSVVIFRMPTETVYTQNFERISQLEYDLVRIEDTANIVLAIRDYLDEHEALPEKLEELETGKYLPAQNIRDPETKVLYFYKNRLEDFVLCVYLSDKIKGVNTEECPKK